MDVPINNLGGFFPHFFFFVGGLMRNEGVSAVVGTLLMVAITVTLAGILYTQADTIASSFFPEPQIQCEIIGSESSDKVTLMHMGGEVVHSATVYVDGVNVSYIANFEIGNKIEIPKTGKIVTVISHNQMVFYGEFNYNESPPPEDPPTNNEPTITNISPENKTLDVSFINLNVQMAIDDADNDEMNWWINVSTGDEFSGIESELTNIVRYLNDYDYEDNISWTAEVSDGELLTRCFYWFIVESMPNEITIINPNPTNQSIDVSKDLTQVQVEISNPSEVMNWEIETSKGTSNSGSCMSGTITCPVTLNYEDVVTWWVNVTDGVNWENRTYSFTVEEQQTILLYPKTYLDDDGNLHASPSDLVNSLRSNDGDSSYDYTWHTLVDDCTGWVRCSMDTVTPVGIIAKIKFHMIYKSQYGNPICKVRACVWLDPGWSRHFTDYSTLGTTSYQEFIYEWALNPATNAPWTWTVVNSLMVEFWCHKLNGAQDETRLTQAYIEVFIA